jgi:type 1 fimbriae regulatory protein FimB/type 1 fimbriae regulatory protein FimE
MKAAGKNRYGHRDATMILIAFRHGLRPVEVCNLKWDSIDLAKARIHVNRAKNGEPSTHPLSGVELRALVVKATSGLLIQSTSERLLPPL